MRYLISSDTIVKGPIRFSRKLEKPINLFQDVRVIAFPAPKDEAPVVNNKNATITSIPEITSLSTIIDGNKKLELFFLKWIHSSLIST